MAPFPCARYGAVEDDLHVLLLCPFEARAWSLLHAVKRPTVAPSTTSNLLITSHSCINLPPTGLNTPLCPWFLWNLRKSRNKLCFEDHSFSEWEIVSKSIKDAKEWSSSQNPSTPSIKVSPRRPPIPLTSQLSLDQITCHADAAWDSISGNCGYGCLFSGNGRSLPPNVSDSRSFVSSALMGEALAIRAAVMTAFPGAYHFSLSFETIVFSFISRLCNVDADCVAKSALDSLNLLSSNGV
ncbi:hypothetical protein N665_1710s0003 [Sinapis alba]|nr:hypothetical protein N665_1710s0003 [Sinapis alba]